MTIRKEDDGLWTVWHSARHPVTKKPKVLRRIKVKSKAEALRVEKKLIKKIIEDFQKQIVPNWDQVLIEFIEYSTEKGLSLKTIENRNYTLRAYTKEWMSRCVDSITSIEIRDLIISKTKSRSPSQQKNLLKYIRLCMEYALEAGYINRNPSPQMKFKVGDKLKRFLTKEQVRTLLTTAKNYNLEWYPHWSMALYTGMRNGELYALTWDKVSFENRLIKVDCSWSNKEGFKSTKSGDERFVEIAPTLLQLLKELKVSSFDQFVLPRIDKWDKGEQARELRFFLQTLGLPQIRFHDLRATWATLMLSKGVPPIKVMKMGGWKEIKTMQIYMRLTGLDIGGITDDLDLHDHNTKSEVLEFKID